MTPIATWIKVVCCSFLSTFDGGSATTFKAATPAVEIKPDASVKREECVDASWGDGPPLFVHFAFDFRGRAVESKNRVTEDFIRVAHV